MMKRLLIYLLVFLPVLVQAQSRSVREVSSDAFTGLMQRLIVGKNFNPPVLTNIPTQRPSIQNSGVDTVGALYYVKANKSLYYYMGADTFAQVAAYSQAGLVVPYASQSFGWANGDGFNLRSAGAYNFIGTGQVNLPGGTTGQRLAGVDGDLRYNSTTHTPEYFASSVWHSLSDLTRPATGFGYSTDLDISQIGGTDFATLNIVDDYFQQHRQVIGFDPTMHGDGSPSNLIGPDSATWWATKTFAKLQLTKAQSYTDSSIAVIANSGGTTLLPASAFGFQLFRPGVSGSYQISALVPGANVSLYNSGDTAVVISATPGQAEINAKDTTLTTTTATVAWPSDNLITHVLVKPPSGLSTFRMGSTAGGSDYIDPTDIPAGDWTDLETNSYIVNATTLYISGIVSGTQILILKTPIHR